MLLATILVTSAALLAGVAGAATQPASWPWQSLSGGYNSSINDGRILAYPPPPPGPGFFGLVESAIQTMVADNGGFSRTVAGRAALCSRGSCSYVTPANALGLGEFWENAAGGRGFSSDYCSGYSAADGCTVAPADGKLGYVLAGPPGAMDGAAPNYSPRDHASGGWPASLLDALADVRSHVPDACLAPAGLPESQQHDCAPGLTYRSGASALYVSADAGRQWYPLSPSRGLPWGRGPDLVAVDPGLPAHVVTAKTARDGGDLVEASACRAPPSYTPLDASGQQMVDDQGHPASKSWTCPARQIAWNRDIGPQVSASIVATAAGASDGAHAVDLAGGAATPADGGWRYAALGHLAVDAQPGSGTCDAAHAGILPACQPQGDVVHAKTPTSPSSANLERFCPDFSLGPCDCHGADGNRIDVRNCTFPDPTSLAIDPRNGHALATTAHNGLLWSPDGGRKWRRHGHGWFTRWTPGAHPGDPPVTSGAYSAEPWPYDEDPDPTDGTTTTAATPANDPGLRILTLQGLPLPDAIAPVGDALALDLNAQPELIEHLGRISFAVEPCPPGGQPTLGQTLTNALGERPRVRVTATLAVTWRNPAQPALPAAVPARPLSGVFVAYADSCSDQAANAPLVFRDTASRPRAIRGERVGGE